MPYELPSRKFKHPSNIVITGPSKSGKTTFVKDLMIHKWFTEKIDRVIIVYSIMQDLYKDMTKGYSFVKFVRTFDENIEADLKLGCHHLILMDDVMVKYGNSKLLEQMFTVISHHYSVSFICIAHNIFTDANAFRTVSRNTDYFAIFNSPRDVKQMRSFAQQCFVGEQLKTFHSAFAHITRKPYRPLLLDFHPETHPKMRIRYLNLRKKNPLLRAAVYINDSDMQDLEEFRYHGEKNEELERSQENNQVSR